MIVRAAHSGRAQPALSARRGHALGTRHVKIQRGTQGALEPDWIASHSRDGAPGRPFAWLVAFIRGGRPKSAFLAADTFAAAFAGHLAAGFACRDRFPARLL